MAELGARRLAQRAMERIQPRPVVVDRYLSEGRVAVIGGPEAERLTASFRKPLRPMVIRRKETPDGAGADPLRITGHIGNFTIHSGKRDSSDYRQSRADLVLDLSATPLIEAPVPPPGYLWCPADEEAVVEAEKRLRSLVGTFEKPRYLQLDPDLCAHRRNGRQACTRCLDACPADAILSGAESVEVDHDLCQGGGACATVCPSGALQYQWPTVEDALKQVKILLETYRREGGGESTLVIHQEKVPLPSLPGHLFFPVEELASRGMEFWLGALAYGAGRVVLLRDDLPPSVATSLQREVSTCRTILDALGYPPEAVQIVDWGRLPVEGPAMPKIAPAGHAPQGLKRQLFFMALDHLHREADRPRPMAMLEAGAPFGSASIDPRRCTFCQACVGACPGRALQGASETLEIRFVEANCLQCGMCTRTCPENAIAITPRLLFDREKRAKPRTLHAEEPFHCIRCGEPFASRAVVTRMVHALQGHWMFQDERALERLKLCESCRIADVLQDEAMLERVSGIRTDS